jgi:hypothetical protein
VPGLFSRLHPPLRSDQIIWYIHASTKRFVADLIISIARFNYGLMESPCGKDSITMNLEVARLGRYT